MEICKKFTNNYQNKERFKAFEDHQLTKKRENRVRLIWKALNKKYPSRDTDSVSPVAVAVARLGQAKFFVGARDCLTR